MEALHLNPQAALALHRARELARSQGCRHTNSCFLLVACSQTSQEVKQWLKRQGVLPQRLTKRLPPKKPALQYSPEPTSECRRVMEIAAVFSGGDLVSPLHLLGAMLAAVPECEASRVLRRCGVRQPKSELPHLVRLPSPR